MATGVINSQLWMLGGTKKPICNSLESVIRAIKNEEILRKSDNSPNYTPKKIRYHLLKTLGVPIKYKTQN